jgi:hypothetical protein
MPVGDLRRRRELFGLVLPIDWSGIAMAHASIVQRPVQVEHVTIEATKSFEDVRAAFEGLVPPLDTSILAMLQKGEIDSAREALERLPELSVFTVRNHGEVLRVVGPARKAVQYEIGNPLTATRMTRYRLPASLYAPLRVALYENEAGRAVFEYDQPSTLFRQFGDERVTAVGRELDAQLKAVLLGAVG